MLKVDCDYFINIKHLNTDLSILINYNYLSKDAAIKDESADHL